VTHTHTYVRTRVDLCQRCEHPRDWHRHDDTSRPNENGHNSHGVVLGEEAECPYRCVGYDCTIDGPVPTQGCYCPGFVGADRG